MKASRLSLDAMRFVMSTLVLVLGVVGCTGSAEDDSTPQPEPSEAVTVVPVNTPTPEPEVETSAETDPGPTELTSAETIAPDPESMATMECEPLSEDLLARMRIHFGTPDRSVQVEVGEGLTPGEIWWVILMEAPAEYDRDLTDLRQFLTNAPGLTEGGRWIPLGLGAPWSYVSWDPERLVRGQSALVKAQECLEG